MERADEWRESAGGAGVRRDRLGSGVLWWATDADRIAGYLKRSAVGAALMRGFGRIDMPRWFSEAGVPIRAINAAAPNPTKIESNRKYADFDAVTIAGVGHYLHMTRPAEFNPLLLDAIGDILATSP